MASPPRPGGATVSGRLIRPGGGAEGCLRTKGRWALPASGVKGSFWGDEDVLRVIVLVVAQLCEYTHLKPFNYTPLYTSKR